MRAVVQRVKRAQVRVGGQLAGRIDAGILILLGIARVDTPVFGHALAAKILNLRIFDDANGQMNRSLLETGGGLLCVSQFTLYGDCRKGRRPSYHRAATPAIARDLYESFLQSLRELARGHNVDVQAGQFQAVMEVELVNDGPVTLLVDSDRIF